MEGSITRREFLAGAVAATMARTAHSVRVAAVSEPLSEFDYGAVIVTDGPLKQQYDRIRAAYLALDNDRLLKVYRERAGLPAPGEPMGGWYGRDGFVPGHSLGQYISGLARIGRTTGDRGCQAKVAELVSGFAATLGPHDQSFAGPNAENVWPCYILDKHIAGLIDAFSLSGVTQARELLPRVFQGALAYIPERGRDRVGKKDPPYDETYVLPESLFTAHELTADRAFYDRAIAYLLDREFFAPLAAGHDVLPGRHAYSHVIALSSAAKARIVLGDEKYLRAMVNAWQLLAANQQYATGGWGPNETFIEPHKGQLFGSLSSTVDHFETPCGSYAAIKLARYLLRATGDARYGDGLERVLFNGMLAVKEPDADGDYPYYSTYGAKVQKAYYPKKWPCCSGTLVEGVADYVKNIYFRSGDGVAVVLYTPSQLKWNVRGTPITLTQTTGFPFAGDASFHIACPSPAEFTLQLRLPSWLAAKPTLTINRKAAEFPVHHGFAEVRRLWNDGDKVRLDLPQEFRFEPIDEQHNETVALLRGPLVYVEVNPASGSAFPHPETLRASKDGGGVFTAGRSGSTIRSLVPFFLISDETYTMYADRA